VNTVLNLEDLTVVTMRSRLTVFWDVTPCGLVVVYPLFGERIASIFRIERKPIKVAASCSAYDSILKMEAIRAYETSVSFCQSTRCHILEDSTLLGNEFRDFLSDCQLLKNDSARVVGPRVQTH
jgi:hypothetical protein